MAGELKDRNPAIAALLSLLTMGLGQLYSGQGGAAIAFLAVNFIAMAAAWLAITSPLPHSFGGLVSLLAGSVVFMALIVSAMAHAALGARRRGVMELRWYSHWYVYVPIFLVTAYLQLAIKDSGPLEAYTVPSESMAPTLIPGDNAIVDTEAYLDRPPERGELVVFRAPGETQVQYVRRVIGLAGDRVQMRGGALYLNGAPLERRQIEDYPQTDAAGTVSGLTQYVETLPDGPSYRALNSNRDDPFDNTEVFEVPAGHIFVIGDNRDQSLDSRVLDQIGYLPLTSLTGRVLYLYWGADPSRTGTTF